MAPGECCGEQRDRLKGQRDRQLLALTHFMLALLGWDTNRGHKRMGVGLSTPHTPPASRIPAPVPAVPTPHSVAPRVAAACPAPGRHGEPHCRQDRAEGTPL